MQIFHFHLMPYAHIDLQAIRDAGTAWVTLSNKHYDPIKGADLYNEYLDQMEFADQLGFAGLVVNEHHQTAYGMMPIPGVMAGALARRIKNGRLAVLGRALPLQNNPLQIAEEYAMLDVITRGKLIAGFVRGIGAEYHTFGVNPAESAGRFHEAHDLIIQAWTQPGPFSYEGKYYNFKYVNIWPRPYQQPHPPIFVPSSGSLDTIRWVAQKRYTYCQTLAPFDMVAKTFDLFREEADKAGYESSPDQLAWSNAIFVRETDEIALRDVRPHLEAYMNEFLTRDPAMMMPPGYSSVASIKRVRAMRGYRNVRQTAEEILAKGIVIVGSPNTVREKLAAAQDRGKFNISLTKTQFGTMPHALVTENQIAIAEEILPFFRDRSPQALNVAAE